MRIQEPHAQNEMASQIGKLLRDAFGKGPQSIYATIYPPFIVIYLRNFVTPMEKILLQQGQIGSVRETRELVMKSLIPELKACLMKQTGMNGMEFYYDWEWPNQSGVFVGQQSGEWLPASGQQAWYEGKEGLHHEIEMMSKRVQKKPERLDSYMINNRTLLVVRQGVLIDISREWIRLGWREPLKQAVNNLEKSQLRNNSHIPRLLNARVEDVFIDWDFQLDRSVIVCILRPTG